jgi:putative phosphoribosyl transferase
MMFTSFSSRRDAGRQLASELKRMKIDAPVVLALPRGGVPVAVEVARELNAPLDLLLVRKIGVPWQPELAAAAIVDGESPDLVLNDSVMSALGLTRADIDGAAGAQLLEIERRRRLYLGDTAPISVKGRSAIVVDDGIATGTTAKAALQALRRRDPKTVILAVPVGAPDSLAELAEHADRIVCLQSPASFYAIGQFYLDFHQLSDQEVIDELRIAKPRSS